MQQRDEYSVPENLKVEYLYTQRRVKLYKTSTRKAHAEKLTALLATVAPKKGKFDLVLSNLDECSYIVSACDLPNVYYIVHNAIGLTLKRALKMGPMKYLRQRKLFKSLQGKDVIAVSKGLANELRSIRLFRPRKILQIYNPFDIEAVKTSAALTLDKQPEQRFILHVGRFAKQKRHDVLLHMLKMLPSDIQLVCLCTNAAKLRKLAIKVGVSERVVLPGFTDNPYNWMAASECLVLTSEFEGFGNVLIEALLSGTRVVSANCDYGPNEILVDSNAQYLVNSGEAKDFAEKVQLALARDKATFASDHVYRFEAQVVAKQYLELLER